MTMRFLNYLHVYTRSRDSNIGSIPGDGVGPELMHSVKDVFQAAGVPVKFEEIYLR